MTGKIKPSTKRGRAKGLTGRKPAVKPNIRRMALLALAAVVSVFLGYGAAWLTGPDQGAVTAKKTVYKEIVDTSGQSAQKAEPWYKNQTPPPVMVKEANPPILPEQAEHAEDQPLAYEEALPRDIYENKGIKAMVFSLETGEEIKPDDQPAPVVRPRNPEQGLEAESKKSEIARLWQKNAVSLPTKANLAAIVRRPMIAIVIDDMGVDQRRSAMMVKLPGPMTLAYLTYARDLKKQTTQARAAGHELMLHVAMEPQSKTVDPGPDVLLTGQPPDQIKAKLKNVLTRFDGMVGINNHMGSEFTRNTKGMTAVIEVLRDHGLLFLDSRTAGGTVGAEIARQYDVPVLERNIFLDHDDDVDKIKQQLALTEKHARKYGFAIAIGHPRTKTLKALGPWLESIEQKGFNLVPVSTIATYISFLEAQTAEGGQE